MSRLWMRIMRRGKILKDAALPVEGSGVSETMIKLCQGFDLPNPIWLDKHEREFTDFGHTYFLPEHFLESVSFDRMEIEYLADDGVKKKSADPRNAF